jgi:hypothetical protein
VGRSIFNVWDKKLLTRDFLIQFSALVKAIRNDALFDRFLGIFSPSWSDGLFLGKYRQFARWIDAECIETDRFPEVRIKISE